MLRRRLSATVSAMIVAMHLGSPIAAEPSVDQLIEIKEILTQNDVAGLRAYIDRYPELLDGDSQLAVLLRRFMLESRHLPNYLLSDSVPGGGADQTGDPPRAAGPGDDGGGGTDDPDDNGSY